MNSRLSLNDIRVTFVPFNGCRMSTAKLFIDELYQFLKPIRNNDVQRFAPIRLDIPENTNKNDKRCCIFFRIEDMSLSQDLIQMASSIMKMKGTTLVFGRSLKAPKFVEGQSMSLWRSDALNRCDCCVCNTKDSVSGNDLNKLQRELYDLKEMLAKKDFELALRERDIAANKRKLREQKQILKFSMPMRSIGTQTEEEICNDVMSESSSFCVIPCPS